MWIVIFSVLSVATAISSLLVALFAVRRASRVAELPQARLHSVELRLGSVESSLPEMAATISTVANSVKMARVRGASLHAVGSHGEPDARTDPEGWRAWMNAQLRAPRAGGK
jgi:hypothetical protein